MSELPTLPVHLRVHLAHATVQAVADAVGADILHIKGPAADPSLRPEERDSVDADVLVRPAHLRRFLVGLERFGWQQVTTLRSGGLLEHSANWYQGELGQLDVHVRFPGIRVEPGTAFERLWQDRRTRAIAHRPCVVPGLVAQRLILLLHAARGLSSYGSEVVVAWDRATPTEREDLLALAVELRAEVALAAATGRLDQFREHPDYDYWRLRLDWANSRPGLLSRLAATINAAPEGSTWPWPRAINYIVHRIWFMPRRLASQGGKGASVSGIASAYVALIRRGSDLIRAVRRR